MRSQDTDGYVLAQVQVEAGKYYHYMAVYDGRYIVVYLNGREAVRQAMTGRVKHPGGDEIPLCLGGDPEPDGSSRYLMKGGIARLLLQGGSIHTVEAAARYLQYAEESGQVGTADREGLRAQLETAQGYKEKFEKLEQRDKEKFYLAFDAALAVYVDLNADGGRVSRAEAALTAAVQEALAALSGVDSITLTADMEIAVTGGTVQLTAAVSGTGDYSRAVCWTVSGGGAGTSIDENGLLKVAAGETAERLTVTAVSAADGTVSAGLEFAVYPVGDLQKDGTVTIGDVMAACRILARKNAHVEPSAEELALGDLNRDGHVTITDVMHICKILAGAS